ncbi:ankyrin repeat domain-containing protein [Candidatus Cardinium hertigii]|uniref:ankyrin repeat domain-containing protein n=1 Tax=Candidatus Cardinium hertigii TaxID=247481 RepID=UPI003D7EE1C7
MHTKHTSYFKSFHILSGIAICCSLMTSSCNQLTRYGMNSSSSEQDSASHTEQIQMNFVPTAYFWNSLHIAAEQGDIQKVNQLCSDPRVDVNKQDDLGDTPLHLAAGKGHIEVVRKLLSMRNISVNKENIFGEIPLDLALDNDHEEVVALLLVYGTDSSQ